jgi:predicted ATPase/DNA-binding winged helix-turn-helix (wHTH) protein
MAEPAAYRFGAYRLEPAGRQLSEHDRPLKLGGRAFDLLLVLVERRDRTLSKDELLDLVWPRRVVEENNLQLQVVALRKLLGNGAIATVPGRGYRFVLPVVVEGAPPAAAPVVAAAEVAAAQGSLIGRAEDLDALIAQVRASALVTLAGSAGIGKTRLAQAALAAWGNGAAWVELAPLPEGADAASVAAAAARALGVAADERASEAVAAALATQPRLLVLDNAEHVLAGVASLVALLQARAPAARVLVTSQEVLHLPGEHVLRLAPLSLPGAPGVAAAQASGAVALFATCARAADRRFVLDGGTVEAVVDICRRLDGIPLAIELAAARLPLLGLNGLRARLDERLQLLTVGSRSAPMRQQTLRAALSWSHSLLDDGARRVFRRLGVFLGGFTLEAAQELATDDTLDIWLAVEHLGTLVDKSLVVAEGTGAAEMPRYRLLETARLFALERLAEAGEHEAWRHRHALVTAATLARTRSRRSAGPVGYGPSLLEALAAEVDNARAALRWAADGADAAVGVTPATEASFAFMAANLHAEFLRWVLPWVERAEAGAVAPAAAAALFRRVGACGKNAGHALALRAAQRAVDLIRAGAGTARELHEALVVVLAVGARRGQVLPFEELLAEAQSLERADWPLPPLSNRMWARECWLMRAGRYEEAAASSLAQAEALRENAALGAPQNALINAAGHELALGRIEQAEARARAAIEALEPVTAQASVRGYGWAVVAACEARRGAFADAVQSCQRARGALEMEGDEPLLLPVLAICACGLGRADDAARIAGCMDASRARAGVVPQPAEAAERARLQAALSAALSPVLLQALCQAGARLSPAEALALGFAAAPARSH